MFPETRLGNNETSARGFCKTANCVAYSFYGSTGVGIKNERVKIMEEKKAAMAQCFRSDLPPDISYSEIKFLQTRPDVIVKFVTNA